MNKFESQLQSAELQKMPKSLDERMNTLFTEASNKDEGRSKRFIFSAIAIAASLAIVAGILFSRSNKKVFEVNQASCDVNNAPSIVVASLGSDISKAFGVGTHESTAFFASEKSEIKRLSFIRSQ